MLDWMAAANDAGEWTRPQVISPHIANDIAGTIIRNHETKTLYAIKLGDPDDHDSFIGAYQIDETVNTLHQRMDLNAEKCLSRLPPIGEACLDLRYWLLQAELNDSQVTICEASDKAIRSIVKVSPPEWENDIRALLREHSTSSPS